MYTTALCLGFGTQASPAWLRGVGVLVQTAEADPLKDHAAALVNYQNKERTEDVLRIASFALGVPLEKLEGAQLLWVDRLGIYLFAAKVGGPGAQVNRC